MKKSLGLLVFLALPQAMAQSGPTVLPLSPLVVSLEPMNYHAYEGDPPPYWTLRLHLRNVTGRPLALTCHSFGAPRLSLKTVETAAEVKANLNGAAGGLTGGVSLGQLQPQDDAPYCHSLGGQLILQPNVDYTYARTLKAPPTGTTLHRASWNVTLPNGVAWKSPTMIARVISGKRPEATPDPLAYQLALDASGAQWFMRTSGLATGQRLAFGFVDVLSRQAFLNELGKRGLDPGKVDIWTAPPVTFPPRPAFPHEARIEVTRSGTGYEFKMTVTNFSEQTVDGHAESCEPLRVTRVADGETVWQEGNATCAGMGVLPLPLSRGESNSRSAAWKGTNSLGQAVPSGQYRVTMGLGQFSADAVFEVRP